MKFYISTPRRLLALIAGCCFAATVNATDVGNTVNSKKANDFEVFYLSRAYSKGFTEDPRKIDENVLLQWGLPTPQLIFTSRAYNNAVYSYPQPGVDFVSNDPAIVYVDKGYGQAIYSYPNNVGKGLIIGWPEEVH